MGGYFGSMHGGAGDDFISAVEAEAIKYPDHSIYIDDASNNPNEFVISSSRRDDAQGPQSHYLTSIHVDVYERDGMIYVDGQPFSSYAQAAAKILTDLEDERQYSAMNESHRKHLRQLILKEFKQTGRYDDFDFGGGAGGGQLPPVKPPRRGGGGGGGDGEEPRDFRGRSNDPCGFGNPKGDYYYDLVFNSFGSWLESNMTAGSVNNEYDNYLEYLKSIDPEFTMDLLSDRYMEFFELLMTAIAEYACENNIRDIESIYRNPMPAILNF